MNPEGSWASQGEEPTQASYTSIEAGLVQKLAERVHSAQRALVVSHIRPDGDAVGSLLGLGLSLQAAGKDVQMVLSDGVPTSFRHLPGSEQVRYRSDGVFDLVCVVDCSDLKRTGEALNGHLPPDINIDHHVTNLGFARINLVDVTAVSTSQILAELLPAMGLPVTQSVGTALLTGLITDSLGFRTSNMTPKALRVAADLMDLGLNLPELYRRSMIDRSFEAARLWGSGLSKVERDDSIVWTSLSLADRREAGYPGRDDADIINVLSSIEGADVALVFVEQPAGRVKVSWRAAPGFDVSRIAVQFGGGGHPSASGADINGTLDEVRRAVLNATHKLVRVQSGMVTE